MTLGAEFADVLRAAQEGEEWAMARLYRDTNPVLLAYARARAPGEADDLVADTWLAIARGLRGFSGDGADFRAWAFTIAHRQVVGHWRKAGRRRTDVTDLADLDRPSTDDTAAEGIERAGSVAAVDALVAGLPPDQADVVLLRVVAGLDVEQVALLLGKKPGHVRVLQHRAIKKLQQLHGKGVTP